MAETLDKQTLTRLAWLTELRRQGHRQCTGEFAEDGQVCALGLLGEIAGIPPRGMVCMHGSDIGALAGMKLWQCQEIVARNDGTRAFGRTRNHHKHTFAEIADVVEGWFR